MISLDCDPAPGHRPRFDQVLSTHRTGAGTTEYVRCTCGGFVIYGRVTGGSRREISHAAATADRQP